MPRRKTLEIPSKLILANTLTIIVITLLATLIARFDSGSFALNAALLAVMALIAIVLGYVGIPALLGARREEPTHSLERTTHEVITGLDKVVAQTGVGAARNAISMKSLSSRIEQAHEGMESMAIATGQIQEGVERVATQAGKAAAFGEQVDKLAQNGNELGMKAVQANETLQKQVHEAVQILDSLSVRVKEITQVSQVINDISDQTKLLALNAAIEAARAGEQGRGFAVVASEVKKLAEHSWEQTGAIDKLVAEISASLESVVGAVSQSRGLADIAAQNMGGLGSSLQEIHQIARDSAQNMQDVSVAVNEQNAHLERLSESSRQTAEGISGIQADAKRVVVATESLSLLSEGAYKFLDRIPTGTPFNRVLFQLRGLARDAEAVFEGVIRDRKVSLKDVLEYRYFEYKGAMIKSLSRLFDVSRVPQTGFVPAKFGTPYDALVDAQFARLIDELMAREPVVNTATIIDLNGYIPMHPTKVCRGWTGDHEKDLAGNRCKKFYLAASLRGARVGLSKAALLPERIERQDLVRAGCDLRHSEAAEDEFLVQTYSRDTGEVMVLLTVPVFVQGQRYGAATATWAAE